MFADTIEIEIPYTDSIFFMHLKKEIDVHDVFGSACEEIAKAEKIDIDVKYAKIRIDNSFDKPRIIKELQKNIGFPINEKDVYGVRNVFLKIHPTQIEDVSKQEYEDYCDSLFVRMYGPLNQKRIAPYSAGGHWA